MEKFWWILASLHASLTSKEAIPSWTASIFMGSSITPFFVFIDDYVYKDWEFAKWFAIIFGIDTITGMWAARKEGKVKDPKFKLSSKGFKPTLEKFTLYSLILIVINILATFRVNGESFESYIYIQYVGYSSLMVRESWSILENINRIRPNIIPKAILEKLKQINKFKS